MTTKRNYQDEWARRNPEKVREAKRRYRLKNKDRIYAQRKADRANNREKLAAAKKVWALANPDLVALQAARKRIKAMNCELDRSLRFHYDITRIEYERIKEAQGGVCAICRKFEIAGRVKRLVVDHCHATGRIRALLCHRCNCGIGYFKDNAVLVRRAAAYLEAFDGITQGGWASRVRQVLGSLSEESCEEGRPKGMASNDPESAIRCA